MFGRSLQGLTLVLALGAMAPALAAPVAVLPTFDRDGVNFIQRAHAMYAHRPGNPMSRKFKILAAGGPFVFFRGSAQLFYRDVAEVPGLKSAIAIPLQGDLHVENMGAYRTANGAFAYDLNDFDEAITGPYTWELARGATSIHLAAAANGMAKPVADRLVKRFLDGYSRQMGAMSKSKAVELRPLTKDLIAGPAIEAVAHAVGGDRAKLLSNWTEAGRLRLNKKIEAVPPDTRKFMVLALEKYARGRREQASFFTLKDVASRRAGVASQCRYRYVVLVEGASPSDADDVLLDFKEAGPAAAVPYLKGPALGDGERIRRAWSYFVPEGDVYLGVAPGGGADFLVRELGPWYGDVGSDELKDEATFGTYLDTMAKVVARAHWRSGKGKAIAADAGRDGGLGHRIGGFAATYADQVNKDHAAFKAAFGETK